MEINKLIKSELVTPQVTDLDVKNTSKDFSSIEAPSNVGGPS